MSVWKHHRRWVAANYVKGKREYVGTFKTKIEADVAYYYAELVKLLDSDMMLAYRLCSPDFMGLTHQRAAFALGITRSAVTSRLKRLKVKLPALFPLYPRCKKGPRMLSYDFTMDIHIKQKF